MTMDHEYATEHHSVEQYLLGELNGRERDEFEEHYFSCPECAEAVRTGAYFADNARFAAREKNALDATPPKPAIEMQARQHPSLWHRLAAPVGIAAALAIAIVGYRNLPGSGHERAHILARTILEPAARGEETVVTLNPGQKSIVLKLDVNSEEPFAHYRVDLQTQDGKPVVDDTGDRGTDGALEIEIPSAELAPGHYVLLVRGQNGTAHAGGVSGPEITRSRLLIKK